MDKQTKKRGGYLMRQQQLKYIIKAHYNVLENSSLFVAALWLNTSELFNTCVKCPTKMLIKNNKLLLSAIRKSNTEMTYRI